MKFFNGIMHGEPVPDEFRPHDRPGCPGRHRIADAATRSLREDRKVKISGDHRLIWYSGGKCPAVDEKGVDPL